MTVQPDAPPVVRTDQARVYQLRLGEARVLMDGERSGGAWWMAEIRQEPGFITPLHRHARMDEHFFVLEGVLSLYIESAWRRLEAGALAVVPRGVVHAQGNFSQLPVSVLSWGNPAGFEHFFAAQDAVMNRMTAKDPQSLGELAKLVGQYDTEVLGPPPV